MKTFLRLSLCLAALMWPLQADPIIEQTFEVMPDVTVWAPSRTLPSIVGNSLHLKTPEGGDPQSFRFSTLQTIRGYSELNFGKNKVEITLKGLNVGGVGDDNIRQFRLHVTDNSDPNAVQGWISLSMNGLGAIYVMVRTKSSTPPPVILHTSAVLPITELKFTLDSKGAHVLIDGRPEVSGEWGGNLDPEIWTDAITPAITLNGLCTTGDGFADVSLQGISIKSSPPDVPAPAAK